MDDDDAYFDWVPGPLGTEEFRLRSAPSGSDSTREPFDDDPSLTPGPMGMWDSDSSDRWSTAKFLEEQAQREKSEAAPASHNTISTAEKNVRAFLRLIRYAETGKDDDSVYNLEFGGSHFEGYAIHPLAKPIKIGKYSSTAAGAYQILYGTWLEAKNKGLVTDFSPASQDLIARDLIQRKGALADIIDGNLDKAIPKLNKTWASLPGGSQQRIKMTEATSKFKDYIANLK